MNTFQTLLSLVTLILALCVIVQAIQEVVKSALNTKASVMEDAMNKFMGPMLPLAGIKNALNVRGLKITTLERFRGDEFRHLLNGITIDTAATTQLIAGQEVSIDQAKDHMAAFFESSLASFQKAYTRKNKIFAVIISAILVGGLNANVLALYGDLTADPIVQQAILAKATSVSGSVTGTAQNGQSSGQSSDQSPAGLGDAYAQSRNQIAQVIQDNPDLLRTRKYPADFKASPFRCLFGLLIMAGLVSLGAPFWNDILKSMMGVNNVLNSKGSASS